jgi:hypothetical protein
MLTKKDREKILKSLTPQQMEALKDEFDLVIAELTNIEKITTFEELLGKQMAIKVLKEIMYRLKLLKESPFEKKKSEYE